MIISDVLPLLINFFMVWSPPVITPCFMKKVTTCWFFMTVIKWSKRYKKISHFHHFISLTIQLVWISCLLIQLRHCSNKIFFAISCLPNSEKDSHLLVIFQFCLTSKTFLSCANNLHGLLLLKRRRNDFPIRYPTS